MKHRKGNKILGRRAHHRVQLLKILSSQLLEHGAVVTTTAKAKALQRHFEPLVTQARQEFNLHRQRILMSQLGQREDILRLKEVAGRIKRSGGYTRITKMHSRRTDSAEMARIEIIEDEGK